MFKHSSALGNPKPARLLVGSDQPSTRPDRLKRPPSTSKRLRNKAPGCPVFWGYLGWCAAFPNLNEVVARRHPDLGWNRPEFGRLSDQPDGHTSRIPNPC